MKSLHYLLGLSVLVIVVIRIGVRIQAGVKPAIQPPMPRWQATLADVMHYALYSFMLAMPLLGWLTLSAAGKPIVLFGFRSEEHTSELPSPCNIVFRLLL